LYDLPDKAEGSQQSSPVTKAYRVIVQLASAGYYDQYEGYQITHSDRGKQSVAISIIVEKQNCLEQRLQIW